MAQKGGLSPVICCFPHFKTLGGMTYYLSLLVILLAVPSLAEKPKGGRLVVEGPYRVSLGDFPAEQIKTVAFKLKNVGDAPIGIMSVSRACGCADAFMTTNVRG